MSALQGGNTYGTNSLAQCHQVCHCEEAAGRRGNLAAQARMTKSPGETVKLHRASFRQNVFDISGTGGYNKDVETPTVATNIEQLSVCEFFIHKPVSRLIAADGSLFSFSKPVNDLADQPDD